VPSGASYARPKSPTAFSRADSPVTPADAAADPRALWHGQNFLPHRTIPDCCGRQSERYPATFLLDTGANRTIVGTNVYGNVRFEPQRIPRREPGAGLVGYSLRRSADLELGEHVWIAQQVSVMNLDELTQMLHLDFDGLLGQDILRQFRSVRIDYRAHVIELQE
jgi:Aspartyl protease